MPDDPLTSRQHNELASYWKRYDASNDAELRGLLRQLIERTAYQYGFAAMLRELDDFHKQRRVKDADAERRRG